MPRDQASGSGDTRGTLRGMTVHGEDPVTTVKVPRSLRTRIARNARTTDQSAAGFLTTVIDRWEREQRLAAVRRAYDGRDQAYREETEAWDHAHGDGLDGLG